MPDPVHKKADRFRSASFAKAVGPETSVLDPLAECVKANASQGSDRDRHTSHPKKRTGLGPHLCPQIRGVPKDFGGYVRSSEVARSSGAGALYPVFVHRLAHL